MDSYTVNLENRQGIEEKTPETGISNTPSNQGSSFKGLQVDIRVDTFRARFKFPNGERFKEYVEATKGDRPLSRVGRALKVSDGVYFDDHYKTPDSHCTYAFSRTEDGDWDVMAYFTGGYFADKPLKDSVRFLWLTRAFKPIKVSRIDLAIDDYTFDLFPKDAIEEAVARGDVAGVQKTQKVSSGKVGERQVETLYLGGRKSEAMTRLYNHQFKDGTESHRWETEFKGRKAQAVYDRIVEWEQDYDRPREDQMRELGELITSIVIGHATASLDFIDKTKGGTRSPKGVNRQDCKRFQWWQKVLDTLAYPLALEIRRKESSWQDTANWLIHQGARSLYALREVFGAVEFHQLMKYLVENGSCRSDTAFEKKVEELRLNKSQVREVFV